MPTPRLDRRSFQKLAWIRLRESKALIDAGEYSGAYYLCGYSVEAALKACIAKNVRRHEFPDRDTVRKSYSHDLEELMTVASLKQQLDQDRKAERDLRTNWAVVKDWTVDSRYEISSERKARDLQAAVANTRHGVFKWLRKHW